VFRNGVYVWTVCALTSLFFVVTGIQFWITPYLVEDVGIDLGMCVWCVVCVCVCVCVRVCVCFYSMWMCAVRVCLMYVCGCRACWSVLCISLRNRSHAGSAVWRVVY